MRWPVVSMRALVVLALVGIAAAACGHEAGSSPASPSGSTPSDSRGSASGCVSASAPVVTAGAGTRRVVVPAGRVVTLQLVEPEAYASSTSGPPPSAFPWLAGQSSNSAALRPVTICPSPPQIMSLPSRLYPFRALRPGRYQVTAPLNRAYHLPHMRPPLPPLHPVRITVIVKAPPDARSSSTSRLYSVTASVLYRPGMTTPQACLVYLQSLPPAGCSGAPVAGYDFERLSGVTHFGTMGWQTPLLRLVGAWNGHTLVLARPPSRARAPGHDPEPPSVCEIQGGEGTTRLAKRITRAHNRLHLLELLPCGRRVWVLVAVADPPTRAFIGHHFGRRVIVSGWLRPA
jgi:hypothetical protein